MLKPKKIDENRQYYVYIMASKSRTLYTGVTSNLERRAYEHKRKLKPGFTSKYNVTWLVYFETTRDIHAALSREKQIKGWLRTRKIVLIESVNPQWKDLSDEWYGKSASTESSMRKGVKTAPCCHSERSGTK